MALLNFPDPGVTPNYTANGNSWEWNGTSWISANNLDLGNQVTGVLSTVYGGTGKSLSGMTVGSILYADTNSSFTVLAPGSSAYVLASAGTGNTPYWKVDDAGGGSVGNGVTGGFAYYTGLNSLTSGSGFSFISATDRVVLTNQILSLNSSVIDSGVWSGTAISLSNGGTNGNRSGLAVSYQLAVFNSAGSAITQINTTSSIGDSVLLQSNQYSFPIWVGQSALVVGGATTSGSATSSVTSGASGRWIASRTVTFSGGDITGSFSIDGSANVSGVALTISADSVALGTDTTGNYAASVAVSGSGLSIGGSAGEGTAFIVYSDATPVNTSSTIVYRDSNGLFAASGATFGSVQIDLVDRTVTTSSGNLILDSTGGTVNVNDNLTISGDLTVNGTTTTVNSTTTTVVDPIITIGTAIGGTNPSSNDSKDRGIEFKYFSGIAKTGFFGFDNSTGYLTFIPDATNNSEVFNGTTGVIDATRITGSASSWTNARTVTFSGGDITGSFSIDGSANVSGVALTIASDSVALGTDTTGNYVGFVNAAGTGLSIIGAVGEGVGFTVVSNANSGNVNSTIVARDGSGNFSASTITANLTGAASLVGTGTTLGTVFLTGVLLNTATGSTQLYTGSGITIGNNTITASTFQGTATSSNTSGLASKLTVSSFTGAGSSYLVFSDVSSGTATIGSTTFITVNASTGNIGATSFTGNHLGTWSGNAVTAKYGGTGLDTVSKLNVLTGAASGNSWIAIGSSTLPVAYISDTAPALLSSYGSTQPGQLWWDSAFGVLKVYYTDTNTSQWVDALPVLGSNGGSVKRSYLLSFGAGFTPSTGSDSVSILVPYAADNSVSYYYIKRLDYRSETTSTGAGVSFFIERSSAGSGIWTTANRIHSASGTSFIAAAGIYITSYTLTGSGASFVSSSGVASSVISGDYLRLNFSAVNTAANLSVSFLIEEQ